MFLSPPVSFPFSIARDRSVPLRGDVGFGDLKYPPRGLAPATSAFFLLIDLSLPPLAFVPRRACSFLPSDLAFSEVLRIFFDFTIQGASLD